MKILITLIFVSSLFLNETRAIESKIVHNIENEIITLKVKVQSMSSSRLSTILLK